MIISPSSSENKIYLLTENQNEKGKINEKPKIFDKNNITLKNKTKKEEEKDLSYSYRNKLNKKNFLII